MSKENGKKSHTIRNRLLFAGVISFILLQDPKTSLNVLKAWFGQQVECYTDNSGNSLQSPADVLAITDSGPADDPTVPGPKTRQSLQAAAFRYWKLSKQGRAPKKVVLLNGTHDDGPDVAISYLQKEVAKVSDNQLQIPRDSFITSHDINTSESARSLAKIVSDGKYQGVEGISPNAQKNRLATLVCANDVPFRVFDAETMLMQNEPSRIPQLKAILKQDKKSGRNAWEDIKLGTLLVSPEGDLLTIAKWVKYAIKLSGAYAAWI